MSKLKTKHKFPPHEYVVAVTVRGRTRYFYGAKLKDATAAAGSKLDGRVFTYWKLSRGEAVVAEKEGDVLTTYAST